MTDRPAGLADALARVQAQLHAVPKDKRANAGTYSYTYADLASVQSLVYPLLSAEGLAWIALPTWDDDGKFVLSYSLMHGPSGERESGTYPLPDPTRGTPQQAGSALTYARRYCLSAVVGVATEDDDGKAASDGGAPKASARPRREPKEQPAERGPVPPAEDAWSLSEWSVGWRTRLEKAGTKEAVDDRWRELKEAAETGAIPESEALHLKGLLSAAHDRVTAAA